MWVDWQGREEAIDAPRRTYNYPRISPDGTKVALDIRDQENDIWIWDVARETLTRLTFDPGSDRFPVWTPDGRRIAFTSMRAGPSNLFWQRRMDRPRRAADGERNEQNPTSFSPAGTSLVFYEVTSSTARDIVVLPLEGQRRATPLVQTTFEERDAEVSPDGRWVAYRIERVRPVRNLRATLPRGRRGPLAGVDRRRHAAALGAERARAVLPRRAGAADGRANSTRPNVCGRQAADRVRGPYFTGGGRSYDVSPDGRRFLMIKDAPPTGDTSTPPQRRRP